MSDALQSIDTTITALDEFLLTSLSLFDDLPIGCVIVDSHGVLRRVNRTFADYMEAKPDDIEGRRWPELVHPEDRQQYEETAERLRAWMDAGKPGPVPVDPVIRNRYLSLKGNTVFLCWKQPHKESPRLPTGLHVGYCIRQGEI